MQRQPQSKIKIKSSTSVDIFLTSTKLNAKLMERKPKPIVANPTKIHKGSEKHKDSIS